jgi:hypothetical protein
MSEESTGQERSVQVHVDASDMATSYANAFQAKATPEEILISFGINERLPQQGEDQPAQVRLTLDTRVVLNPYTAKRLVIQLSQMVRQHELQFGLLELDVSKRIQVPSEPKAAITEETANE